MSLSIYVSPAGSDQNSGSIDAPLASLYQAREAVRSLIASFKPGEEQDIDVHLTAGTHCLNKTLVLDHRDSGSERFKVTWKGSDAGDTVISSGHPLAGWQKLEDEPAWLADEARGHVWFIDLPKDSRVTTLYGTDGLVPRAKGEAMIPQELTPAEHEIPSHIYGPDAPIPIEKPYEKWKIEYSHTYFAFPEGAIADTPDLHEAECLIIPRNQWTMNILAVKTVDFDNNIVHLKEACTYPIGIPHCAPNGSIWLENSLSVLTPGSWVYHRESSRLYYCPAGNEPEEGLEAALLTEFIRVEGSNEEPTGLRPVQQVHFEEITFTRSGRFSFHGLTGKGIQHDWEMHDAPSCMVRFRHVHQSSVTRCRFVEAGAGGVRLDLAATENTISDCEFSHLGGCGVVLCGYGLSRNYLNHSNTVSHNHLHHLGLFYWHCPGIFIWQSGNNTIADNHLHDLPYTGIVCSGRTVYDRSGRGECSGTINWDDVEAQCGKDYVHNVWHYCGITSWWMREPLMHSRDNLIEYNRIHDVMQTMGDGNGIYVSGAGGGNVVRFNAVGPCPSPTMAEGIRCDDDQHHTIIHGNLIFGQGGHATAITLKGINQVTNNIMALPFVDETTRGMLSLETGPLNGSVIKHNIFYTATPGQKFVSEIRIHGTGRKARLRDTESDHNIYYCTGAPELGNEWVAEQQGFGNDYASLGSDPGFVDAEKGDFNLKPDSTALKAGFSPLPLVRMLAES
jgi:hypothetical protein